jgi:hypothetical protein
LKMLFQHEHHEFEHSLGFWTMPGLLTRMTGGV